MNSISTKFCGQKGQKALTPNQLVLYLLDVNYNVDNDGDNSFRYMVNQMVCQLTFTCLKSTIETLKKDVKYTSLGKPIDSY